MPLRQFSMTFFDPCLQTYMAIDYSNEYDESKHHAQLAASYLAGAVEADSAAAYARRNHGRRALDGCFGRKRFCSLACQTLLLR